MNDNWNERLRQDHLFQFMYRHTTNQAFIDSSSTV